MYEATETFSAPGRTLRAGETVEDDDPLVDTHAQFLRKVDKGRRVHTQDDAPVEQATAAPVEQATAAPGEKRNTRRT